MDSTGLLFIAFILTYIGGLVYVANQIEAARTANDHSHHPDKMGEVHFFLESNQVIILRWLLFGLIGMMAAVGLMMLQVALLDDMAGQPDSDLADLQLAINPVAAIIVFGIAAAFSFLSYRIVTNENTRQWLHGWLGRWGRYDPQSPVHTAALVLMLAMVVWTLVTFVLQGGISGMADELAESSVDAGDLLFQGFLQVVVAFLGVGLAIRRDWSQALARLGLRLPTRDDLIWGIGLGIGLILVSSILTAIWGGLISSEMLSEQTAAAEALNRAFATLPMAFIVAFSAAVGEEIWVRGALQPVFGLVFSSLFFVVLHTQVALTPGTLIILSVSLALGWLRQRYSTTTAIIAHFVYNFVPLALLSLVATA